MATVSLSLPADGTTADVADYNTPITTLVNEFNGNIDNANIKSGAAIATSKLADDAGITAAKIGTGAVTDTKVADGFVVQKVYTNSSALATGTTQIPHDDTIPQITEGTEFMTLAITPKSATNIIEIEFTGRFALSVANDIIGALFQDSTANALAVDLFTSGTANGSVALTVKHQMVAGTTSPTTFRLRAGGGAASTITLNGFASNRKFGGAIQSSMTITEHKAS